MPIELADTVIEKTRFTSGLGRGSVTTAVADGAEEKGRMRPARQQNKFRRKPRQHDVSGGDFSGSVAVNATLSAVLAGDVAVGVTSPVGFAGNASPDAVLLAACIGVASRTDHAEGLPLAVAEVASSADIAGAASSVLVLGRSWGGFPGRYRRGGVQWVLFTPLVHSE